jgi:hypothetical protein
MTTGKSQTRKSKQHHCPSRSLRDAGGHSIGDDGDRRIQINSFANGVAEGDTEKAVAAGILVVEGAAKKPGETGKGLRLVPIPD